MQVPITLLGLVGSTAFPQASWLRPIVLANSIVGLAYMHLEYKALKQTGFMFLGHSHRTHTYRYNLALNVVSHVIAPIMVIPPTSPTNTWWHSYVACAVCPLLLDLERVYPTANNTLQPYVVAYALVLVVAVHSPLLLSPR